MTQTYVEYDRKTMRPVVETYRVWTHTCESFRPGGKLVRVGERYNFYDEPVGPTEGNPLGQKQEILDITYCPDCGADLHAEYAIASDKLQKKPKDEG